MPIPGMSLAPAAERLRRRPSRSSRRSSCAAGRRPRPRRSASTSASRSGDPYDDVQIKRNFAEALGLGPLRGPHAREGGDSCRHRARRRRRRAADRRGPRVPRQQEADDLPAQGQAQGGEGRDPGRRARLAPRRLEGEVGPRRGLQGRGIPFRRRSTRRPRPWARTQRRVVFLVDEGDKMQDRVDPLHGQHGLRPDDAPLRDEEDDNRRTGGGSSTRSRRLQPGELRGRHREPPQGSTRTRATRTSSSRTRSSTRSSSNPQEKRREKIKRRARITIPIVEGETVLLRQAQGRGLDGVPGPISLERFFGYRAGKPLSRAVLADGMKTLDEIYRGRGYIYVFMNPEYTEKPNHVVDVDVEDHGRRPVPARAASSSRGTRRRATRCCAASCSSSRATSWTWRPSRRASSRSRSSATSRSRKTPSSGSTRRRRPSTSRSRARTRTATRSSSAPATRSSTGSSGSFSSTRGTSSGRGDTLGVQFQRGNRSNFFDLSFAEPWFLDKRMSIGGSIFNRTLDYSDVGRSTRRRKGVNPRSATGWGSSTSSSFFYGFTDTKSTYQVYPPPAPPGGGAVPSRTRLLRQDVGDHPRLPVRQPERPVRPDAGARRYGTVADRGRRPARRRLLVRQVGRDRDALHPVGKKSQFRGEPRPRTSRGYGTEQDPNEATTIPIFDRYRIGGDRSVRGFKYGAHLTRSTKRTRRSSTSTAPFSEGTGSSSSTSSTCTRSAGR